MVLKKNMIKIYDIEEFDLLFKKKLQNIFKKDYYKKLVYTLGKKVNKKENRFSLREPLEFSLILIEFYKALILCFQGKLNFFQDNYVDFAEKHSLYFFASDDREISFLQNLAPSDMMSIIKKSHLGPEIFAEIVLIFLAISKKKQLDNNWLVDVESFNNNVLNQLLVFLFSSFIKVEKISGKSPFLESWVNENDTLISNKFKKSLVLLANDLASKNEKTHGGGYFAKIMDELLINSGIVTEISSRNGCFYYVVNTNLNEFFLEFSE